MADVTVKTQAALDAAVARTDSPRIVIASPADVWLVARGSAHVEARGSAHVEASRYVSVHRHSREAQIEGGVIIEIPPITTVATWCEYYGASVDDGVVTLYKALDAEFKSGYGFLYLPGSIVTAPDWDGGRRECGGGLHGCASPIEASGYHEGAVKFVAVPVKVADIAIHHPASMPNKVKFAKSCGPCVEVDRYGKVMTATQVVA